MNRKRRGRGEGAIFQRADGLWVSSLSLGYDGRGKRKRQTVYGKTKQEVQEKLVKLRQQASTGMIAEVSKLTVAGFLDQWLATARAGISNGTYAVYDQHVRNLIKPHIGGIRLASLNALIIQSLYRSLNESGKSASQQRKAGVTLRAACSWGVTAGLLADNPVKRTKMPKHDAPEPKPIELEQLATFVKSARQDRLFALYPLAVDSGCRQGELLALTWRDDVDFDRGSVSITKSLEEVGGKLAIRPAKTKKSKRTIMLSAFTVVALQQHRMAMLAEGSYDPAGPVFCGVRSKTYLRKSDLYRHSFRPILERAGLSFRFHDLRHCCATLLLMAGTDIKTVQERLGHSTAVMTLNTYSHVLEGSQAEAARKLNAILNSPPKTELGYS